MSVELTRDIVYPHVTEDDIDGFLDAEGNVINWRQRCLDQGRAEGRAEGRLEERTEIRPCASNMASCQKRSLRPYCIISTATIL